MKVLLVNKFFFARGGAERYVFALRKLLMDRGHAVMDFSMQHPDNLPSPYEKYFVSNADFERVRFDRMGLRVIGRMLYSLEARRKLTALIERERPDIAHLHNIYHQISPSILSVFAKYDIPVVMTVHDFHLLSPNYLLYHDGRTVDLEKGLWECVRTRCIKHSLPATLLDVSAFWLHRAFRLYENSVDRFFCSSRFLMDLLRRFRPALTPLNHLPHFLPPAENADLGERGSYALFVGRLSEEKGVEDLLHALSGMRIPLRVAGTGPQKPYLKRLARELGTDATFLGFQDERELHATYRNARFVVAPSRCFETGPLVAYEAMQYGKPLIGPRHSTFPEVVDHERTGLLYAPRSTTELRAAVQALWENETLCRAFGAAAAQKARHYTEERFYAKLLTTYEHLLAQHR